MDSYGHPHLPIEQLVRRTDTRFQLGFAAQAKALLPDDEAYRLEPSRTGLRVLGRNEEALASPVEALREAYGPRLAVEPPRARLIGGAQLQEPVMQVRISLETRFAGAVKRALERRGARAQEEYVRATYCVLRYEAPLAALLGLPAELAALSEDRAKHWTALSHYAIVTRDPGPDGRAA
jgi:predicted membrane GTPase involved in stress response